MAIGSRVKARVTLIDAQGLKNEPKEFSFTALSDASLATFQAHISTVFSLDFDPMDSTKLGSSALREIKLWKVSADKSSLDRTLQGHESDIYSIDFSPDGKRLVSGSPDGRIKLWDLSGGISELTITGHGTRQVHSVAFSPDGKRLASSFSDGVVRIWDVSRFIKGIQ